MKNSKAFPDQIFNGILTIECPYNGGVSLVRQGNNEEKKAINWDNRKPVMGLGTTQAYGVNMVNGNQNFIGQKHWPIKIWYCTPPSGSRSSMKELFAENVPTYSELIAGLHDMAHDWAGQQRAGRFTWKFVCKAFQASCEFNWEKKSYLVTITIKEQLSHEK